MKGQVMIGYSGEGSPRYIDVETSVSDSRVLSRDWWLFQYSARHLKIAEEKSEEFSGKVSEALKWLLSFHEKTSKEEFSNHNLYFDDLALLERALISQVHKKLGYQEDQDIHNIIAQQKHIVFIEALHVSEGIPEGELIELQMIHSIANRYGFLFSSLTKELDDLENWDVFIAHKDEGVRKLEKLQDYVFQKKGACPKGFEIIPYGTSETPEKDYNLLIYLNVKKPFSAYKSEITSLWKSYEKELDLYLEPHKKALGKNFKGKRKKLVSSFDLGETQVVRISERYDVAIYVDKRQCSSLDYVLEVSRLQRFWTRMYVGLEKNINLTSKIEQPSDKEIKEYSLNTRKWKQAVSYSEGLIEKQKNPDIDNIRRTIGLFVWDCSRYGETRNSVIEELIHSLTDSHPEILDVYKNGYASLGGSYEDFNVVRLEMHKDVKVADKCIERTEFLSHEDVKTMY